MNPRTALLGLLLVVGLACAARAAEPPTHHMLIGPVPGFTIGWHDAPPISGVSRGTTMEFVVVAEPFPADFDRDGTVTVTDIGVFFSCYVGPNQPPAAACPEHVNADLDGDGDVDTSDFAIFALHMYRTPTDGITWSGATEVYRTPLESTARRTFTTVGTNVVSATALSPTLPDVTLEFVANVINVSPASVQVTPITVTPTPLNSDSGQLPLFYGPSIAQVRESAPGSYVTSIDRPFSVQVDVSPPEFSPLIEWRLDGAASTLGPAAVVSFSNPGQHSISASGKKSVAVETYGVTLLTDIDYRGPAPNGPITFQVVTEPPGHEDEVVWIADTLHGSAGPNSGVGASFTVEFDNTYDPFGDADGITQWYGVRADNARSGVLYFVDQSAPDAADSNLGMSSAPWKTLTRAESVAGPGDTVYVRPGDYDEGLYPAVSGAPSRLAEYRAVPNEACLGDVGTVHAEGKFGCGVRISGGVGIEADYVRLEGFEITGRGVHACGIGNEIVNNYIHDLSGTHEWGIETCYDGDIASDRFTLIENNEVTDTSFKGIFAFGEGVIVRGNYVHDVGNDPTKVQGTNVLLENNRIGHSWEGHADGIEVYEVDGLVIRNNHIYDTTQNIYISAADGPIRNVEILGNVVWCRDYCASGNNAPGFRLDNNLLKGLSDVRIEGNTFYFVWNLVNSGVTNVSVRNNIFVGTWADLEGSTNDYNLYYRVKLYGNPGAHSLVNVNPRFMNPTGLDYRLQSGSPAIDAGRPASGLDVDPAGIPRPQGNGFDIGAYEYNLTYSHE